MNFSQILAAAIQAYMTRSAAFAITVGTQHFAVTITQNASPSGSPWMAIMGVVMQIMHGQPGTFTVGSFTVAIAPLTTLPSVGQVASGTGSTNASGLVPPGVQGAPLR